MKMLMMWQENLLSTIHIMKALVSLLSAFMKKILGFCQHQENSGVLPTSRMWNVNFRMCIAIYQGCGAKTILCRSGSDFQKVSAPALAPEPKPAPAPTTA